MTWDDFNILWLPPDYRLAIGGSATFKVIPLDSKLVRVVYCTSVRGVVVVMTLSKLEGLGLVLDNN